MIPYSWRKLFAFYGLSQTKLLHNPTLHSGTYVYILYMGVPTGGSDHAPQGQKHIAISCNLLTEPKTHRASLRAKLFGFYF